jgi:aspartate/methionine/tyrosine aminotransferase
MRSRRLSRNSTLTAWEDVALQRTYNLADGHAHHRLSPRQVASLGDLTQTLVNIESSLQRTQELDFLNAFNRLSGQSLDPSHVFLHYSSSVSIDLVAKLLRARHIARVALMTPTFDNIPLLLRRHDCELLPAHQRIWVNRNYRRKVLAACEAIFLVCPNNPTGLVPEADAFDELLTDASTADCLVIIDFSFRLYTSLHTFDQYERARHTPGLQYIFLEDSGKVYPCGELKCGLVSATPGISDEFEKITDELLLNVSPMALHIIASLMRSDDQAAGLSAERVLESSRVVSTNRGFLRTALANFPIASESLDSKISVEWLRLPSPISTALSKRLGGLGLAILPGRPFIWHEPTQGERFIRIALARDPAYFAEAIRAFLDCMQHLTAEGFFAQKRG